MSLGAISPPRIRKRVEDADLIIALGMLLTDIESGGRADLVAKEQSELTVLQTYLPAQLSDAELDALITEAVASSGATSIKDMGKVMALVKAKAQGKADMGAVSARIKQKLS